MIYIHLPIILGTIFIGVNKKKIKCIKNIYSPNNKY